MKMSDLEVPFVEETEMRTSLMLSFPRQAEDGNARNAQHPKRTNVAQLRWDSAGEVIAVELPRHKDR